MKKLLSILLILCSIAITFTGCNEKPNTNTLPESSTTPPPATPEITPQELELEAALRLEKDGCWSGAAVLLDDLISRGYYSEYANKRDELYEKDFIANAVHIALEGSRFKQSLKDPSSLVIYSISITPRSPSCFDIVFEYGAKNSFGGMVRDTFSHSYSDNGVKPYYEGKKINCSHINLEDLAKMSYYEWDKKQGGDYKLYYYKFRYDVEGNIWGN